MEWINVATGQRVQSDSSPGSGWVDANSTAGQIISQRFTSSQKDAPGYGSEWTGDTRVKLLGENGYTWEQGEGPAALWRSPSGQLVPESAALQSVIAAASRAPGAERAPERITSGGVVYERSADGNWSPARGIPAPAESGGGMTAYQSVQAQQWQQQFDQTVAAAERAYQQRQAELQQQAAINAVNMDFARSKESFAQSQDNKRLAMQARGQIVDEQYKAADLQMRQSSLDMQYQTFNATAANEAAKFNAQMAFSVQQANQQFESQRQDRLANIATQAGTLAQDTGNRGRLAAQMLAQSGWGGANQATSGQDYRDTESTTPLESLLRTRRDVQNQSAPYAFTPVTPTQITAPQMPQMQQLPSLAGMMGGAGAGTQQTVTDTTPGYTLTPNGGVNLSASEIQGGAQWAPTPGFKDGGVADGAYVAGERGPELIIPQSDGSDLILNEKQVKSAFGFSIKDMMNAGQPQYAGGGIFDGAFSNVNDSDRELSMGFLSDAYRRAIAGTTFEGMKQLPSPVYLSSPGTNPLVAGLVGSLKALGEGVPADQTGYLASLYRPTGLREMVTGRSR